MTLVQTFQRVNIYEFKMLPFTTFLHNFTLGQIYVERLHLWSICVAKCFIDLFQPCADFKHTEWTVLYAFVHKMTCTIMLNMIYETD